MGFPGSPAWRVALGRNWSHQFADRIVIDPVIGNHSVVWLLTRAGTFRRFSGLNLTTNTYESASPSDEYRTLRRTSGWELEELDGTVHTFGSTGRWISTLDPNNVGFTGAYLNAQFPENLTNVDFPDERKQQFNYDVFGRLQSIVETGTDNSSTRTWTFTWSGDDLTRIDRPDSRAWSFVYGDPKLPGYITRLILIGIGGAQRYEGAWAYDLAGNVVDTWKGSNALNGTQVEHWHFEYTPPASLIPTSTKVIDPFGNESTHTRTRGTLSVESRASIPFLATARPAVRLPTSITTTAALTRYSRNG